LNVNGAATIDSVLTVLGNTSLKDVSTNNLDVSGTLQMNNNRILFGNQDQKTYIKLNDEFADISNTIGIGRSANEENFESFTIGIGYFAGNINQRTNCVAIGYRAGEAQQQISSIAVGNESGRYDQSFNSIAIGSEAGWSAQGSNCIALGTKAGYSNQHANTIILNATGNNLLSTSANSFYVAPIRSSNPKYLLGYTDANEITQFGSAVSNNDIIQYNGTSWEPRTNVSFSGTLNVTGKSTLADVSMNNTDISGTLRATGATTLSSTLAVAGATTLSNTLNVAGRSSLADVSMNNADVSGNLQMNRNRILFGSTNVNIGSSSSGNTAIGASNTVAIGSGAGTTSTNNTISIGNFAGNTGQKADAIALGTNSGQTTQGAGSIAIGAYAGQTSQGDSSIAIGRYAGNSGQGTKTIILNATDASLNGVTPNAFYVAPIRDISTNSQRLTYNSSTNEITREDNTLALLRDVSGASSATNGMGLIYNTTNTKWEARKRDYYLLTINGDLSNNSAIPSLTNLNPFVLDTSATWFNYEKTADFSNNITFNSSNGQFSLSTTKTYKVSFKFSINVNSYGGGGGIFYIKTSVFSNNSSSTPISSNRIRYQVTDIPTSIITDCYVKNSSYIYAYFIPDNQTIDLATTLADCIATIDIVEV